MGHEYVQGIYRPINREKYKGRQLPVYRSKLERRLFQYLDRKSIVEKWCSECCVIPYQHPLEKRSARYFVDIYAEVRIKDKVKKYIIEVKPDKYTRKPTISNKKAQKTIVYEATQYAINTAKWEAANKWAAQKDIIFIIVTEKTIDELENRL